MSHTSISENHYEVIIVGGGPAGISCALTLARCRRKILVIDAGNPRNYAAQAMNGFITRDGESPMEFLNMARKELNKYDVDFLHQEVVKAQKTEDGFLITTADNRQFYSIKLLLATGVSDDLPAIKGVNDFYGRGVYHCPYCDGWENRNQPFAVYAIRRKAAVEVSLSMLSWTNDITLLTDAVDELRSSDIRKLKKNGIKIHHGIISHLEGKDGKLSHVVFENQEKIPVKALFFTTGSRQQSNLAGQLNCKCDESGAIKYDKRQHTSVKGLYVAGDMAKDMQLIIVAAAEGAKAAVVINSALNKQARR